MSEARVRLNALPARYPRLFPDGPPPWGFEVGDGWCPLLETLCARLDTLLAQAPGALMRVEQVKEKFATLRFYYALEGADAATAEAIREAVDLAEAASAHICERCARPGERYNAGGWLCTLCTACQLRGP
jgi:hypothetical protein